jgi:ribosomal protein L29
VAHLTFVAEPASRLEAELRDLTDEQLDERLADLLRRLRAARSRLAHPAGSARTQFVELRDGA